MKFSPESLGVSFSNKERKVFDLIKEIANKHCTIARVAGGYVRDKILKVESHDIDISVNNMSGLAFARLVRECMKECGMPVPKDVAVVEANPEAKKSLETAILKIFGVPIDFVQLRSDVYGAETRHPETVSGVSPEKDAERRDLTVNAIFYNINEDKIEDFVGGVKDLNNRIARTPLDPYNTFMEDPLRILRAVRFAAKYSLEVDPKLIEMAKHPDVQNSFKKKISKERIWSELVGHPEGNGWKRGLMIGPNFHRAAKLIGDMGIRDLLFVPNEEQIQRAAKQSKNFDKGGKWECGFGNWDMNQNNPHHTLTVWEHTLAALSYLNKLQESRSEQSNVEDQLVRNLAMLLHDIGKCDACSQQTHPELGHSTYHAHELSSALIAEEILYDLRAPNNIRERIVILIKNHMRLENIPAGSTGSGLRRVVRDVGIENWPLLVDITKADRMGKEKAELDPKYDAFVKAMADFFEKTDGKSEVQVPLNGKEIMQILGLDRGGPLVGDAIKALQEQILENPEMTKEEAKSFVKTNCANKNVGRL